MCKMEKIIGYFKIGYSGQGIWKIWKNIVI